MDKLRFALFLLFSIPLLSLQAQLRVGADRLDTLRQLLGTDRIGLLVNHTAVQSDGKTHLVDAFLQAGFRLQAIFAPEHGFRGEADAGALLKDERDIQSGLPVISLYGKNKKPTPEQLQGIDCMVFDIQDVGARFYTYISTLYYAMQACAEAGKKMVVLDRPNPNDTIDGPVLKEVAFRSFVGALPLPVLHGLTVGELARMIVGEGWLESSLTLSVVPVEGWRHGEPYSLPIKPSPNLPNDQAVALYPSLCLFEATAVSVGRGTSLPFQVIGYPDPAYGSYSFTPKPLKGSDMNPLQKGKTCYGLDLHAQLAPRGFSLRYLLDFYQKSGCWDQFITRPHWFDLLAGESRLREQILAGKSEAEIRATWQEDLADYRQKRERYLLY